VSVLRLRERRKYYRSRRATLADGASWRKSSFSAMNGSCVEIGRLKSDRTDVSDWIGVRDTKDHGAGPILTFTNAEWSAFIAGVKSGQFDNP
jgi:Domain of unknown function (DUF397)